MRTLGTTVHVYDDDEKPHVFGPGDTPPDWAIAKITNPAVWAGDSADVLDDPALPDDYTYSPDTTVDVVGEPSESWTVPQLREYAKDHEIDLGEASKKADILAAIKDELDQ